MNIDDLPVDEVALQKQKIALVFERGERGGGAQLERAGRGLHDFLRGDEAKAIAGFEHQSGHTAGIGAGGDGDVFELAAEVPLGISDRSAEQARSG